MKKILVDYRTRFSGSRHVMEQEQTAVVPIHAGQRREEAIHDYFNRLFGELTCIKRAAEYQTRNQDLVININRIYSVPSSEFVLEI